MPQLVKGGKYIFAWSRVGSRGRIVVPPEALMEYHFKENDRLILISGSRTSGGFGLVSKASLLKSPLGVILRDHPELGDYTSPEGHAIEHKGKCYYGITLINSSMIIPLDILERYGIRAKNKLLVIRGSGLALGFVVRGPIVEEARKHTEILIVGKEEWHF